MSEIIEGLDKMKFRLDAVGGIPQEKRMQRDKLMSLKRALLYSYQAATAIIPDGRMFRCLINPDKLKNDYDDKIISIPFEDVCLGKRIQVMNEETGEITYEDVPAERKGTTTMGLEPIDLKPGDVFEWKETNSFWLVYLRRLEEDAYFRAEIRKCDYELDIDGTKYKVYARGPEKETMEWHSRRTFGSWNSMDYAVRLLITKNEQTENFFHRFTKIKFKGKPWEVQVVDNVSVEGVLEVSIKEWFQNSIEEAAAAEAKENEPSLPEIEEGSPHITGEDKIYPYDTVEYRMENATGGKWEISNTKARIIEQDDTVVKVFVTTGKSGEFDLIYKRDNEEDIVKQITILSL